MGINAEYMGGVISVLRIFSKSSPQMKATWISFALLFSFSNAHHDGFHSGSSANGFPGRDGRRRSGGFRNFGSSGGFDGVKLHDAVHGDGGSDVFDVNFSGGGTLAPQLNVIDKTSDLRGSTTSTGDSVDSMSDRTISTISDTGPPAGGFVELMRNIDAFFTTELHKQQLF